MEYTSKSSDLFGIIWRNFSIKRLNSILYGVAVGDVLSFPAQFESRSERKKLPGVGVGQYKDENGQTYSLGNDLTGLWSDDTSLTLCLSELPRLTRVT